MGDDQEADIRREDLRRMFRWSQDWQMLFNLEKCSVMHMGVDRYEKVGGTKQISIGQGNCIKNCQKFVYGCHC